MPVIAVDTQFGRIGIEEQDGAIIRTMWDGVPSGEPTALLTEAARQLTEYDQGGRTSFDLPFRVEGSAFQQAVCAAMSAIPFGDTRTYGEIA